MPRQAFEKFLLPARRRPALWRMVLGLVLIFVVFALWMIAMFGVLVAVQGTEEAGRTIMRMTQPDDPVSTLMLLMSFVGMALGPVAAVRLLHGRRARTLIGPLRLAARDFAVGAGAVLALWAAGMAMWFTSFEPLRNLSTGMWLALLPVSLLGVAVQTLAEELIFRGYLVQQLAVRFQSAAVAVILPSMAFGMLHYDPTTMGSNAWAVVASTAFFGLIAADLTRATGNLGCAWGLHFANNVVALLFLSTQGTITGLALYVTPYAAADVQITGPLLMADMTGLILLWAILRRVLRR